MNLFLTTNTMNTEPVLESLPDAARCFYDRCAWDYQDREMLDAAYAHDPETVIYIGCTGGPHLPSASTFAHMRKKGRRTVCLAFDASDESWHPHLAEFREKGSFDLVVNIDGNDEWPRVTERDFTALTPIASRYWEPHWLTSLDCRPVRFGFAGGYASPSRAAVVTFLQKFAALAIPVRDEKFGTYQSYADFMMQTRVALSVPWSGVSEVGQVKGRVLEAGWAGACLLEHADSPTRNWFTPGVDYAVYRDRNEALMAVHQLLYSDRGVTAQRMADNLARRVRAEHSAEIFWGRVWEALK
jgi:hypothetical protein